MRGTSVAYAKSEVRSTNMRRAKYVRRVTSKRGGTDKSSGQLTEVMRREIMCSNVIRRVDEGVRRLIRSPRYARSERGRLKTVTKSVQMFRENEREKENFIKLGRQN